MARKTSPLIKRIIDRHADVVRHYTNVIEAKKRGDENPIYQGKSIEHIQAIVTGQTMMVETVIMEANCYHGYHYVDRNMNGPIKTSHPDYAEWRRVYLIKE